ncbi:mycothiol transferase [Kitasatospora sp. NPDC001660]
MTSGQLRARALEPSGLSLPGLVRHFAEAERGWSRNVFAGRQIPPSRTVRCRGTSRSARRSS